MNSTNTATLFAEADQMLLAAEAEINRSAEDVVTHLVCHNSRQSIVNYLTGYLLEKGASLPHPLTLAALQENCSAVDPRFKTLDLSPIHCRFDVTDNDYCLSVQKVEECLGIARRAGELVR